MALSYTPCSLCLYTCSWVFRWIVSSIIYLTASFVASSSFFFFWSLIKLPGPCVALSYISMHAKQAWRSVNYCKPWLTSIIGGFQEGEGVFAPPLSQTLSWLFFLSNSVGSLVGVCHINNDNTAILLYLFIISLHILWERSNYCDEIHLLRFSQSCNTLCK